MSEYREIWRPFIVILLGLFFCLVPFGASGCLEDGEEGASGAAGSPGSPGAPGGGGEENMDGNPDPLSGIVAQQFVDGGDTGATHLAGFVKARVAQYVSGTLPVGCQFPLTNATTDTVRGIQGTATNVVVKWLDPLTFSQLTAASPNVPHFGANVDYLSFFGEGWDAVAGNPPQWNGSSAAGWIWSNHEYISVSAGNDVHPDIGVAPKGQPLSLCKLLQSRGVFAFDVTQAANWTTQGQVDTYIQFFKRQLGGSWFRVIRDPASGAWVLDRSASNKRFDATSNTQFLMTGYVPAAADHDDLNVAYPNPQVVTGTLANCAGSTTPWGTILSGEENPQDYYGDYEPCWNSSNAFLGGQGYDPGGNVAPIATASVTSEMGRISIAGERHNRDLYSFNVEIDPTKAKDEFYGKTAPGDGHQKLGVLGRARWENADCVIDTSWKLPAGKPLVLYAGDDRRNGRVFKWVSQGNYTAGMTKQQIRDLLAAGRLYVGHFQGLQNANGYKLTATGAAPTEASPGTGNWIELTMTNVTDAAPNAGKHASLAAGTKVGAALLDVNWNGIGGFPSDNAIRASLYTACAKIGVSELNRPEDVEWNPFDKLVYFTLTNHTGKTSLDDNGVLPGVSGGSQATRADKVGRIWVIKEADQNNPHSSPTFTFHQVWEGTEAKGDFDAANPDNLLIDRDGGVWFGTDGNYGTNQRADAFYYLDLNAAHKAGQPGVVNVGYGKAFRIFATPSNAEHTGPTLTPDMRTLFHSVQHPGEAGTYSQWP